MLRSLSLLAVLLACSNPAAQTRDERVRALTHYRLGLQFLIAEAWKDAERQLLAAVKLDPRLSMAYYGLGRSYMGLKSYQEAVRALSDCRDSFRAEAGRALTDQLRVQERRQEQLFEMKQALQEMQSSPLRASGSGLGASQTNLGIRHLQEQMRDLERDLHRGGTVSAELQVPAFVSLALGSAYFRSGSLPDAEREYLAAVKVNSNLGEAHNNLAVVYMMTGRLTQAEEEIKLAEKAGFRVNPQLKEDLRNAKRQ